MLFYFINFKILDIFSKINYICSTKIKKIMKKIFLIIVVSVFSTSIFCQTQNDIDMVKAAYDGDLATVTSLLTKGAKVDATDSEGYTALIYAAAYGYQDIMKLLIDKGAEVKKLRNEVNPMFAAVNNNNTTSIEMLIKAGADINCLDSEGYTPLMFAAQEGYLASVEYLISQGAKIDLENNDGHTALSIAAQNNFNDIVEFIIQNNPKKIGYTVAATAPLNTAVYVANNDAEDLLTKYGMKKDSKPGLEYASGGTAFYLSPFDLLSGAAGGLHEGMFKLDLFGGYVFTNKYSDEIFKNNNNTNYLKTTSMYFGSLNKRFDFYNKAKASAGLTIGADLMLAFGENSSGDTSEKFLPGGNIGGFYKGSLGLIRLNYTYLSSGTSNFFQHRISLSVHLKLYKFPNSQTNFTFADKTLYML